MAGDAVAVRALPFVAGALPFVAVLASMPFVVEQWNAWRKPPEWLLVVPPHDEIMAGVVQFDASVPLAEWEQRSRRATQEKCEQERATIARVASLHAPDDSLSRLYDAARCIDEWEKSAQSD